MSQNNEHILDLEAGRHLSTSSGDEGACLTRHLSVYNDTDSCSHRWQGYRTATAHPEWYNSPAYDSLLNHPKKTYRPEHGKAWNLAESSDVWRTENGKKVQKTVPNFRELASVPYAHNSHHVIPNSVLNGALLAAAESDMQIFVVTRVSLLEARYNINHTTNVVILPMRRHIAKALGLPRHISGVDSRPNENPERVNHSSYNDRVRVKVLKVIRDFADQIASGAHAADAARAAKAELEGYSAKVLNKLQTWSSTARGAGRALNKAPPSVFA